MGQGWAKCPDFEQIALFASYLASANNMHFKKYTLFKWSNERSSIKLMTSGSAVKSSINCANPAMVS